ncbi:MAG: hypothetical protein M1832_005697 [Thelocarpon impressellum]|nr:MAG: hypothetical protein M1832_005697 [Thelocarpon impressellum]
METPSFTAANELSYPQTSDKVFVRDLKLEATLLDAWGRPRLQPIRLSVTLSLAQNFQSAADFDKVDASTVHYGLLSKNIVASVGARKGDELHFAELITLVDTAVSATVPSMAMVRGTDVEICLPKASLLGAGVSFLSSLGLHCEANMTLHLMDVKVPTIIGVNDHEKEMKQLVVVNLWLQGFSDAPASLYGEIEQILVKSVEESVFETLESLATWVASMVIKCFMFRFGPLVLRLRVEKPTAVMLAEAPGVEITRTSSQTDPFARQLWDDCGRRCPDPIPFPLKGRLDAHLNPQPIK